MSPLRRSHLAAYLCAALAFLYLRAFLLPGTPLAASGDETMFFAHAIRLLHGQVPYVDYENFLPPGCDLFYALAFRLFGVHAWLAQTFPILLGLSLATLILVISRRLFTGPLVYLPGLLFLTLCFNTVPDATHHWYSDALLLAAAVVLLSGITRRNILAAGALCGLATLFTQSQGLLGLLAIAAWLYVTSEAPTPQRLRELATLAVPYTLIVAATLAWCIHRAGAATMYFSLVTFVFRYFPTLVEHTPRAYLQQPPPHHRPADLAAVLPWLFTHLMLPFGYLCALLRLYRRRSSLPRAEVRALLLIALLGLALFAAIANAPSPRRMVMVAPLAAIVLVWLLPSPAARKALWASALAGLILLPLQMQLHWRGYLNLPNGRVAVLQPTQFAEYQWLAAHTYAGESSFNIPRINFVLSLDNPTTVDFILPAEYTTAPQVQRAIAGLESHRTPLVSFSVMPDNIRAPGHPGNNLGPLLAYVHAHYRLVQTFPDLEVWQRN